MRVPTVALTLAVLAPGSIASAASLLFSTGSATSTIGLASNPGTSLTEVEAADDFVLTGDVKVTSATFTGLIYPNSGSGTVSQVVVEIYRVFPLDSTTPPDGNVPTRTNSPSDVAFDTRDSGASQLSFTTATLSPSFSVLNSISGTGIHPSPNNVTGGDGPVTGIEAQFTVNFATPFSLAAGHYFFVPQVAVNDGGQFYWLSADAPVDPGDLRPWIRNSALDPDWLRAGPDIIGFQAPPFNMAFTLSGDVSTPTPLPSGLASTSVALAGILARRLCRRRAALLACRVVPLHSWDV